MRLNVYTVDGELVRELVNGNHDRADTDEVSWKGVDRDGSPAAPGVYVYSLEAGAVVASKQMMLVR